MVTCYSRTLAIGIRRQAELKHQKGEPRPTIGNLLCRVEEHPEAFTRESLGFEDTDPFLDGWPALANASGEHADLAKVVEVKDKLIAAESTARDWVNARIAISILAPRTNW